MKKNDLDELVNRIEKIEARISKLEADGHGSAMQGAGTKMSTKSLSLKEFLLSKKPTNDVQKTLAIACYLEKYEKYESFNANELSLAFDRAREKKPLNMNDKINLNIKNGHMDLAMEKKDGLKAWHLTNSGEKFVNDNFEEV